MAGPRNSSGEVTCIDGHLEVRRQQVREHLAQHLERLAARLRSDETDPLAVAAVVVLADGSRLTEVCYGDSLGGLALAASLATMERDIADAE